MTQLLGAADPDLGWIEADDPLSVMRTHLAVLPAADLLQGQFPCEMRSPWYSSWWPMCGGLQPNDGATNSLVEVGWWEIPEGWSGESARVVFTGVTRDAYGSPLGACTVKLFKTADVTYPGTKDTKIDETTSDTTGAFTVMSPYYPDAHYIVSYKAGAPDTEGTTVNTLIGA